MKVLMHALAASCEELRARSFVRGLEIRLKTNDLSQASQSIVIPANASLYSKFPAKFSSFFLEINTV
jgi:hypothetical protein